MPSRYAQWMYDWEHRLTSVDNNRVVRPLEWASNLPKTGPAATARVSGNLSKIRRNSLSTSTAASWPPATNFFLQDAHDFRLEKREVAVFSTREVPDPRLEQKVKGTSAEFLRFTAPVKTPYPENNLVNARWFPARGRRAIVLLPHWNADAIAYVSLCKVLNMLASRCCG